MRPVRCITAPDRPRCESKRMTIVITVLITLAVVILLLNLHTPEKEIRHQLEHYHDILDPQFRREMGALLGPAIVAGNSIKALQNGAEIFP